MALTDKREKFIQNLIRGMSQREAYKAAFSCNKMTDKTIDEKASRLFADVKVRARYNEIHDRLVKEAEDEAIIDAKEVLKEIASIARDDLGNYIRFYTDDGNIKMEIKDSSTIDTKNISEVSIGKDGQFKFKTYCRDTALYKLADILGLSKQKVSVEFESDGFIEALKGQVKETFKNADSIIEEDITDGS